MADEITPKMMATMIQHAEDYGILLQWLVDNHPGLVSQWAKFRRELN